MAEKLIVRIGSNTAGFESGLRKAGNIATRWAKRVTIAMTGVVVASSLIGAKFEQSLRLAGAIAGATGKDFAALEKEARRLGKTTAFTATEAAIGMTNLARTGLKTEQIIKTTGLALEFAGAHATDLGEATNILAAAMNVFEIESKDARRITDTFTFALDNSLLTIDKLREGMKSAGAMGAVLGKSIEETTTALSFFVNLSLEGSRAGMQYRMAMQTLLKQTPRVTKALKEMGLTFSDINPKTLSFGEMLDFVAHKIPQTADSTKTFIALFGRAGVFMELLAKKTRNSTLDFDEFVKKMIESQKEAGITARRYADMMDTFRGQWKILWSAIQELGLSVFSVYRDQGKVVFGFLAKSVTKLADFISKSRFKIMGWILETTEGIVNAIRTKLIPTIAVMASTFTYVWELVKVMFGLPWVEERIINPLKTSLKWIEEKFVVAMEFYFGKEGVFVKQSKEGGEIVLRNAANAALRRKEEIMKIGSELLDFEKGLQAEREKLIEQEAKAKIMALPSAPTPPGMPTPPGLPLTPPPPPPPSQKERFEAQLKAMEERSQRLADIAEIEKEFDIKRLELLEDFNQQYADIGKNQFEIERDRLQQQTELWERFGLDKERIATLTANKLAEINRAETRQRINNIGDVVSSMTQGFKMISEMGGKHSKEAFAMYKAFKITETIIATYSAAIKAYESLVGIPFIGPFIAPAAAAVAVGFGMAQVAMIKSAQPPSYDEGGIATGPKSGYEATLHGTELIVSPKTSYPATVRDGMKDGPTINIIMENPVFQDLNTQRQAFAAIATEITMRIAPSAVKANYEDDGIMRSMVRGRI